MERQDQVGGVGERGLEGLRFDVIISEDAKDAESGRTEVWCRNECGMSERREMTLDSSLLYHSESDFGSDSEASSSDSSKKPSGR